MIEPTYLGIEIGGTKLQLGLGSGDGALTALFRERVDPVAGADGIRRQIASIVPVLLRQAGYSKEQIAAVGVGFGGPIDDAKGCIIKSHQIGGWDEYPLAQWMEDLLGVPSYLGNDADLAGLAEALHGAGKGLSPVFYITVGSGIGGGLILGGRVHRGTGLGAAEIGHLRMRGSNGEMTILEHLASGWAIEAAAKRELGEPAITVSQIAGQAQSGDQRCRDILERAWTSLAEGICQVIALVAPQCIVIGGGVSLLGEDAFFAPLRRLVRERVFAPFAECYRIVPAALGEQVVVHGAISYARSRRD